MCPKLHEKVDSLVSNSFLNNSLKLCFFLDYPWLAAPGDKTLQIPDKVWFQKDLSHISTVPDFHLQWLTFLRRNSFGEILIVQRYKSRILTPIKNCFLVDLTLSVCLNFILIYRLYKQTFQLFNFANIIKTTTS